MSWGNNTYGQLGDGLTHTPNSTDKPVHVCKPEYTGSLPCPHLEGVVAVSAGGSHSLALLNTGEVVAWGRGQEGALGNRETGDHDVPVYVCEVEAPPSCPHLKEVIAISAGNGSSNIALLKDHEVVTWGSNMDGQLGDGTLTPTPGFSDLPVRVCAPNVLFTQCESGTYAHQYLKEVSAVSAAPDHDAAIVEPGGELFTWGVNNRGQLGQGDWSLYNDVPEHVCEVEYTYTVAESANNVLPHCGPNHYLTGVELISFGLRHNIAEFSGAYCLRVPIKEGGHNPEEGEKCRVRDGEPAQEGPEEKHKKGKKEKEKGHEGGGRTWEEEGYEWIEEHAEHGVVSFGNNEEGQLGDGLAVTASGWTAHTGGPASCESGTPCSEVPVHVCKTNAPDPPFPSPCPFPEYLEPVTAVAAGGDHSLALNVSGEVLSWGENDEGEQGIGGTPPGPKECSFVSAPCSAVPLAVPGIGGIVGLSGGSFHELALENTGEVWAWGKGIGGQLGDGSFANSSVPVPVCAVGVCPGPLTGVTAVSAGSNHSLALGEFPSGNGWSQKGKELPAGGSPVAVKTTGSLTLQTEAGPVTCKVKDVEEIWNSAKGEGEDRITSFVLSCKSKLCPVKQTTIVNALGLPWPSHLTSTSPVRDEIEKVDLEIRCSISGLLDEYKGTLAPEVGNSVLTFGPGSGELEDSSHNKAGLVGTDKLAGKITA